MSAAQETESKTAPWIVIPENDITSIEHPCIVKNNIRAIEMLGGGQKLAQNLEQGLNQSLSLKFSPNDPACRTVMSLHNKTSNVLLKVTVPQRTGRKRKRGSNDDFIHDDAGVPKFTDASYLLRSLLDNRNSSAVEAVGNIGSCHIWRGMPDFAYFTKTSTFLRGIETHLLPQQYPLVKKWSLPRTYGLQDTEVIPPPILSAQSYSHNYTYRQNPAVKTFADPTTGTRVLQNRALPLKQHIQVMVFDDPTCPMTPSPECPAFEEQPEGVKLLTQQLRDRFEARPIWTRRALINSLPVDANVSLTRIAAAYVCYSLRSGPWRDSYCKLGVDPRSDHKYRFYQTILLKLHPNDRAAFKARGTPRPQRMWARSLDQESHIFTGTKKVGMDGSTWQMCDLKDPDLQPLVDVPELYLRAECESRYFGWYANGTSAKIRVLLKAKIDALTEERELDRSMIEKFLQLPEIWSTELKMKDPSAPHTGYLPTTSSTQELEWAAAYRNLCRTADGAIPTHGSMGKGRLSKPKPTSRPSFIDMEEMDEDVHSDEIAATEYQDPDEGDEDLIAENGDDVLEEV